MGYFDALMRYFEFGGRTSRSQYWTYQLFAFLLAVVAVFADFSAIRLGFEQEHVGLLLAFVSIFHIVPSITATVRRLHDIGKSGFWYLLCFVPFGGIVVLIWTIRRGDAGANDYGDADGGWSEEPSSTGGSGYEPPPGRLVRMGNASPRAASSIESSGVSTTRFI